MDLDVTRGSKDEVHHLQADQGHTTLVLNQTGGPYSDVALYHLYRTVASCTGEENDWPTRGRNREEFGSFL